MTTQSGILDLPERAEGGYRGRVRIVDSADGAPTNFRLNPMPGVVSTGQINHSNPLIPEELADEFHLRNALEVVVEVGEKKSRKRKGGRGGKPMPVVQKFVSIEGLEPQQFAKTKAFHDLTSIDPQPRLTLEHRGCPVSCRLIDLFCPIGRGTRGLIVSPPKAGKTTLLKDIAMGLKHNHPDLEVFALLIDERPEEVTDFKRNVPAQVLASSNDNDTQRHIELALYALERAKRMVETGKHVVYLLDSLTRLGRAFNASRKYAGSGRTMSGGLDSRALEMPRQIFGAARNTEDGGSLTILATCLVDTGSAADQVIFEEFKGSGNMELILDRRISERRLFPAINLASSGTRKEHLLLDEPTFKTVTALRRRLMNMPPPVQVEQLLKAMDRFPTNADLVGANTTASASA